MANINIKKNFVDGDKLFAQQLNNNFETIEKGINDGNKIVWQDGTEVKFKRYVTDDIENLPILDGSIIYDTEKGRHYIDYQGKRVQVGSAGKEVLVQEEQPTEEDNKIWIDSDTVNTMGTEITNEHSESEIMGYSAKYLNDRLLKVDSEKPETREEVWIDNVKKRIHVQNANGGYEEFKPWYNQKEVNDLLELELFDNKVTFNKNVGTIHFTKQGKMVNINYRGSKIEHTSGEILFVLPEGYRPVRTLYFFAQEGNTGGNFHAYINNYGECVAEYTGTARILFNISFATETGVEKEVD